MTRLLHTIGILCASAALFAQEPAPAPSPPAKPQDPAQAKEQLLAALQKEGIQLDLQAKTVTVPAVVNQPADPLEYLLIHKRGKKHEALCVTEVKPSLLNAALLLLGFQEGKNVGYQQKDPMPTEEQIRDGAPIYDVIAPKGMPVWMTVSWKEAGGNEVRVPIEDLLVDLTACGPVTDASFVFLGGCMAPIYRDQAPVFVADFEGNLVSNCYLVPENHLVTIVHERAPDDQNWWIADRTPPPGTEVRFTFYAVRPAALYDGRDERVRKQNEETRQKIEAEMRKHREQQELEQKEKEKGKDKEGG